MRRKLFLFLLALSLWSSVSIAQAQDSGSLLALINNLRAQKGLPAYSMNGALGVAAQQQAQWIVDTGTIAHTHPDGSGPRTRAVAAGYTGALVGENIYGGTNASLNDAWVFWLNSPIHYEGLVNTSYNQVGIGIAHGGWGSSFVIDFGGDATSYVPIGQVSSGTNNSNHPAAAVGPPPYYGGVDDHGNIKHIVQPGETLGDIALLYGYSWSDLPTMMQLNGLSNVRDLAVGSIFLVPPKGGTAVPTQDTRPPTATPVPSQLPPSITPYTVPTGTLPPEISELTLVVPPLVSTASPNIAPPAQGDVPSTPTLVEVAALPTQTRLQPASASIQPRSTSWILIALAVQVVIVVGAGFEFVRRALRRRR